MRFFIVIIISFFVLKLNAQDSLKSRNLEEVVITASRTLKNQLETPASISIIYANEIQNNPIISADEILSINQGINIDRDFGIFSKNSSISMRGLNGSQRTLVLLDGIPLNKIDGGGINWNRINPDAIERIEIVRGAGSTIYGSNAMGGIINIITRKPTDKLSGKVKLFYGTYNLYGTNIFLDGANIYNNKGLYWGINSSYKKGDGYYPEPAETRDSMDNKTYLKEYSTSIKTGYKFSYQNYIEAEYSFYDNKTGDGNKVIEPDGGYNRYLTNSARISSKFIQNKLLFYTDLFYQIENYLRQNETIKKQNGKYTLYNTNSKRIDNGIWFTTQYNISTIQNIIVGIDFKQGSVDAEDNYKTSTDILTNRGKLIFYAGFLQYDVNIFNNKIKISSGIRYDYAKFTKGSFFVTEPSSLTSFMIRLPVNFSDTSWTDISPKISILYKVKNTGKIYLSVAKGFRAPILDDLCKNGNITKGFKQANPKLKPENVITYEIGHTTKVTNKIKVEQSFYYTLGSDFQYFVATGDSVYTEGDNLKPVLKRENVSKVEVFGTETNIKYILNKNITFVTYYTYSHSVIKQYRSNSANYKDLSGKFLMEVPKNQFSFSVDWFTKYLNTTITYNFRDKQFADDENLTWTDTHSIVSAQFSTNWKEKTYIGLTIQDLFNNRYKDTKGQLSPGRFFTLNLIYKFCNN